VHAALATRPDLGDKRQNARKAGTSVVRGIADAALYAQITTARFTSSDSWKNRKLSVLSSAFV
jgi:hypothetical protein